MSGQGFHVHGPHDHELEHVAQHAAGNSRSSGFIAVITAIVATVGALFGYMGGATMANAGLYKNNAAIKKTEASNQWNFYQAKSSKQNLAELAAVLAPEDRRSAYKEQAVRYDREKNDIKAAAEKLEAESASWDQRSEEQLHVHHRWAQATTALQVSIALAAIALLTQRKSVEWGMYGLAAVGVALGATAAMHL